MSHFQCPAALPHVENQLYFLGAAIGLDGAHVVEDLAVGVADTLINFEAFVFKTDVDGLDVALGVEGCQH